jgi:hypothetical protein
MTDDEWICEDCGEPIHRYGNQLGCENGCFEDDVRNYFSEDEMEEGRTAHITFPPDLDAEEEISPRDENLF